MNIENNERFKNTEDKILQAYSYLAFSKSIDKITVSDICRLAGIHRTTFYGHFQDILELESKVISIQFKTMMDHFITENGWDLKNGILTQLRFYYDHQTLVRRNYMNNDSAHYLERVFPEVISGSLAESYKKHFSLENDTEMLYHQSYLNYGYVAVIKKWVLSGCRETPEEIANIIYKFVE